jgi:hypothetical protein
VTKDGVVRPLAWDQAFRGKLIGGSVYFVVLERTGTDQTDPWGIGLDGFVDSFKEGRSTHGTYSPKLDTRARFLYLYQLVNDRGLDPPLGDAKFAFESNFANIQPVAGVKVDLRVDPRHITSWGYFQNHGLVATVLDREQSGRPRPMEDGTPVITLAVSANSSILGELPRKRYVSRCEAFDLGKMQDSLGIHTSTYNLKHSYKVEILSQKPEAKLVGWERNVLQASVNARHPDFMQLDQVRLEDRVVSPKDGTVTDPVVAWFRVLWQKTAERDNLVYLGHHSPVFGFTTDLEPHEEDVLIEDLSLARRQVEVQAVGNLVAAASASADGTAQGLGAGTVVAPRMAPLSAVTGVDATWLGGTMVGGSSVMPGVAGAAGALGTAAPPRAGGGGGFGGGTGSSGSSGSLAQRPDFSVTLTNQQSQQQQQGQTVVNGCGGCSSTDPQVVPEPGTLLLTLLALPVLYWLGRRKVAFLTAA